MAELCSSSTGVESVLTDAVTVAGGRKKYNRNQNDILWEEQNHSQQVHIEKLFQKFGGEIKSNKYDASFKYSGKILF